MLTLFFFAAGIAAAEPLDTIYLKKLAAATTAMALHDVRQNYLNIREDRRICDVQLATMSIPWACYRLLERERRWNLHEKAARRERQLSLDNRCRTVTKALLSAGNEIFNIPAAPVSKECQRMIARARDIAGYRRSKR